MAAMNARLDAGIETVFLMASERQQFISSRFVKEIGRLGGDINSFVSAPVAQRLRDRFDMERSEEHTSELQSLMRISYAVFCLTKKNNNIRISDSYYNNV